MKTTLYTAMAALLLSMSAAFGAEQPMQDPFRHYMPGTAVQLNGSLTSQSAEAFPDPATLPSFADVPTLPSVGNETPVQTANSLPRGFEQGTVEYTQAQRVAAAVARSQAVSLAARQSATGLHG